MIDRIGHKAFIAPGYKADYAGEDVPAVDQNSLNNDPTGSDLNATVDSIFNMNNSGEIGGPENPFGLGIGGTQQLGMKYDPLTGEMVEDPSSRPYYVKSIDDFLSDSKIAGLNMKISDFDYLKTLYQKAQKDLKAEKDSILERIDSGTVFGTDAEYQKLVIECIDKSLITVNDALKRCDALKEETKRTYDNEMAAMQKIIKENYAVIKEMTPSQLSAFIQDKLFVADINADGWIGEPDKALRIVNDVRFKDGTKGSALYNAETKKYQFKFSSDGIPVTSKWFDPSRTWTVTREGLKKADSSDINKYKYKEDLVLDVDSSVKPWQNSFGAHINIIVPDYITVKADDNGDADIRKDKTSGTYYIPADFVYENGSIKQLPPPEEEMYKYVQKRVDKVEVVSVKPMKSDASGIDEDAKGYDQIVRFKDSLGFIVAEFRIRGDQTKSNGQQFASSFGFALDNGTSTASSSEKVDERKESVCIDATRMKSTCQHNIGDIADVLQKEYNVNLNKFKKTQSVDEIKAESIYADQMGRFKAQKIILEDDTENSHLVSGLLTWGLCGYVEASRHGNNLICLGDPSKYQDIDSKDGSDDPNPLYANVVIGNGREDSYNAVFAKGKGDLYASDVTLAIRNCTDNDAVTAVAVKSSLGMRKKQDGEKDPNGVEYEDNDKNTDTEEDFDVTTCPVFVALLGDGKKFIDNPPEMRTVKDKKTGVYVDATENGDDYFYTEGEGIYSLPKVNPEKGKPGDWDADNTAGGSDDCGVLSKGDMIKKGEEIEKKLRDLFEDADSDPLESIISSDLGGDYYSESYAEMQDAFRELADGLNFTKNSRFNEEESSEETAD